MNNNLIELLIKKHSLREWKNIIDLEMKYDLIVSDNNIVKEIENVDCQIISCVAKSYCPKLYYHGNMHITSKLSTSYFNDIYTRVKIPEKSKYDLMFLYSRLEFLIPIKDKLIEAFNKVSNEYLNLYDNYISSVLELLYNEYMLVCDNGYGDIVPSTESVKKSVSSLREGFDVETVAKYMKEANEIMVYYLKLYYWLIRASDEDRIESCWRDINETYFDKLSDMSSAILNFDSVIDQYTSEIKYLNRLIRIAERKVLRSECADHAYSSKVNIPTIKIIPDSNYYSDIDEAIYHDGMINGTKL